jgi:two-component system, sporulation sensor kinase B
MEHIKDLLFNLLIILIVMLSFQLLFASRLQSLFLRNREYIIAGISIITASLCLVCSIKMNSSFIFDLRWIPFLLGGLYGGPRVILALLIFVIFIRIPLGGIGAAYNILTGLIAGFIVYKLHPYFIRMDTRGKLLTVSLLSFFVSITAFLLMFSKAGLEECFGFIVIYTITQTLGAFLTAYTIELIVQNQQLNRAVMKTEKMEVVSHLAASISHEVRNPLTVTKGFLQLLKEEESENGKRAYYLDTALEELNRAEVIISDYLTFAKPHSDSSSFLSLKEEIQKAVELITPYGNAHSVEIYYNLEERLFIKGDEAKFQQCLLNLLKNAIEAMPGGGALSISAKRQDDKAALRISDTGKGMTSGQLTRLGEPYFSTKEGKGTGLGMMVVFRIIEGMGGKIKAESILNKGTCFTIMLPAEINPD